MIVAAEATFMASISHAPASPQIVLLGSGNSPIIGWSCGHICFSKTSKSCHKCGIMIDTASDHPGHVSAFRFFFLRIILLAVMVVLVTMVSSCRLVDLRHNVKQMNAHGLVLARVDPVSDTIPTYVVAWRQESGGRVEIAGLQRVQTNGVVVFLLLKDRTYEIGAFTDVNRDGHYEGGEPTDFARNVHPTSLSDPHAWAHVLELHLSRTNGLPPGQKVELPAEGTVPRGELPVAIGAIADLKAPQFSSDVGEDGMWEPYEFLIAHGMGIYFVKPYDEKKVPVVLVYGIAGSVQDWREVIAAMDHSRYQPWLFYYPSGIRLDKSANALAAAMVALKNRYGFDHLVVVAHSMGGLVARAAIQRAVSHTSTNFIPEFVTISTPWAGHEAAAMGVKYLDYPVPAWRDMVPNSDYLKRIFKSPLPTGTRYDLIFSYKSIGGFGLPNDNDGVVGVNSELSEQAESQAASIYGFNLEHMGILQSPDLIDRLEKDLPGVKSDDKDEAKASDKPPHER